jgi:L,D-transpeptidase YcbB
MKIEKFLIFVGILGMLYSCTPKVYPVFVWPRSLEQRKDTLKTQIPSQPKTTKTKRGFWKPDESTLQSSLQEFFRTHEAGFVFTADSVDFPIWTSMVNTYKARDWKGIWSNEKRIHELVKLVKSAEYDGLMVEDYHPEALVAFMKKIRHDTSSVNQLQIELLATASFMRYCRDMWSGKVNPKTVFPEWNYHTRTISSADTALWEKLIFSDYDTLPGYLRPQITLYEELRESYLNLDELEKSGEKWPYIAYHGKDLKIGDTSTVVLILKERLHSMGLFVKDPTDSIFDQDFADAIKEFQKNQGLVTNGTLDKKTIARLNFSIKEVKDIIRANMERCRWVEPDTPEEYLLVNITGYQLYYIKGRKVDFSTRIVVGEEDHRTKVFHANLMNVEFNPYWTVTRNIATMEILPILKKDPTYLERNDMILLKGEEIVDPDTLDFTKYSKDNFPFVVKQLPGSKNALGVVKFNMPNPYYIYMHDTPSKADFEKSGRAFSHGCIRVHQPLDLAEYLLKKQGFSRSDIHDLVIKGENTVIGLKQKVPVRITYWTYYKDSHTGKTLFYKDIYGRDQLIINELNKKVVLKKDIAQ